MTYQESLAYLYNSLPMFQRIGGAAFNKSLDKTIALCELLDHPQDKFRSIHIAGTNGKGSVSSMLAAILQSAGYRTGLFTSPHLKSFTERIRLSGREIEEDEVVYFVQKYQHQMEQLKPSFFEFTTVMAFEHFAANNVDVAVIEVGMGGRLDSTNVIHPDLSVITNISYDHQEYLGDTLEKIAGEKAGIIKEKVPVVISEFQQDINHVFLQKGLLAGSKVSVASDIYSCKNVFLELGRLKLDVFSGENEVLKDLYCDLGGLYQAKNIPAVLAAVDELRVKGFDISEDHIRRGLFNVKGLTGLKGRWQTLLEKPLLICDTAHNEGGFSYIVDQINSMQFASLHMVLGVVKDKDIAPVLRMLPKQATYYFCQPDLPRALDAQLLAAAASEYGLTGAIIPNVNDAVAQALSNAAPDDLIFVGGSNFVVAELEML